TLQLRRDLARRPGGTAHFRRMTERQQVHVLAFDLGQRKRVRDAVEHVGRRSAPTTLFEPRVPGRAHVRALRDFFAAEPGRAPAPRGKPERGRVEPPAAVFEIRAERVVVAVRHEPGSHYTGIPPRLFFACWVRKMRAWQCASSSRARPASSAAPPFASY